MPRASQSARSSSSSHGIAVDVDGEHRFRAFGDGRLDRRRIEVQRPPVDVREDRRRAFVERAVRRGDERVRRRHHLVAGADPGSHAEEVEARRAARDRRRVRRVDRRRELLLEAVDRRPERQPPGPEHLGDELLLPLVEPGRGELDRANRCHRGPPTPPRATSRRRPASGSSARRAPGRCRDTPSAARA